MRMAGKKQPESNPWETGQGPEVTVTLKAGKDFNAPWIVIKAPTAGQVHSALLDVMGWEPDKAGELPLAPSVIAASQTWHTQWDTGDILGGRFLSEKTNEPIDYGSRPGDTDSPTALGVPESVAANSEAVQVWKMIDGAPDSKTVKQIYKQYQTTFNNFPELVSFWQKRARMLKDSENAKNGPEGMF